MGYTLTVVSGSANLLVLAYSGLENFGPGEKRNVSATGTIILAWLGRLGGGVVFFGGPYYLGFHYHFRHRVVRERLSFA